jgi:hypothetical protein
MGPGAAQRRRPDRSIAVLLTLALLARASGDGRSDGGGGGGGGGGDTLGDVRVDAIGTRQEPIMPSSPPTVGQVTAPRVFALLKASAVQRRRQHKGYHHTLDEQQQDASAPWDEGNGLLEWGRLRRGFDPSQPGTSCMHAGLQHACYARTLMIMLAIFSACMCGAHLCALQEGCVTLWRLSRLRHYGSQLVDQL